MSNSQQSFENFLTNLSNPDSKKPSSSKKKSAAHPLPHAYVLRISPNRKNTFYCNLPNCNHCLNIEHQVIGRESLCEVCLAKFIVSDDLILKCEDCRQ